jgi:hypothetical protein
LELGGCGSFRICIGSDTGDLPLLLAIRNSQVNIQLTLYNKKEQVSTALFL